MTADLFTPAPELRISIEGSRDARRHFRAEYGAALTPPRTGPAAAEEVRVTVGGAHDDPLDEGVDGGHKTVRWTVALGDPGAHPLSARIAIGGRPRRFALSLIQGFVVEPLVSVAAARAGLVLLPAAALVAGGGAAILLGRSGAGKTSVVARALAAGGEALGDDQILLTEDGAVRPWPRRLRLYPDIRATAPAALRRLPPRRRAALGGLAALRAATRGWVAPSLPVQWRELGVEPAAGPIPAHRVVVLDRSGAADAITAEPLSGGAVAALAREILDEQRARFEALAGPGWSAALADAARREQALLESALGSSPAERWTVPAAWGASTAVGALASRLGVEG